MTAPELHSQHFHACFFASSSSRCKFHAILVGKCPMVAWHKTAFITTPSLPSVAKRSFVLFSTWIWILFMSIPLGQSPRPLRPIDPHIVSHRHAFAGYVTCLHLQFGNTGCPASIGPPFSLVFKPVCSPIHKECFVMERMARREGSTARKWRRIVRPLLACASARAFALSLMDRRHTVGSGSGALHFGRHYSL